MSQFVARRPLHARHELRFGTRELAIFCGAFLLIWGLTFAFGILVGRELASSGSGAKGATATPAASRPALGEPVKKSERTGSEEKLTFYKTLTAPTAELPPTQPPAVEERIVPRESPARAAVRTPPRPESGAPADAAAERPPAARRAEPRAGAVAPAAEPVWTVQVSSFRSRALADELRGRLHGRGFDAYLAQATTEDGRVRWHRVRVGAFSTRAEAERVAAELRGERNLNPVVTTR